MASRCDGCSCTAVAERFFAFSNRLFSSYLLSSCPVFCVYRNFYVTLFLVVRSSPGLVSRSVNTQILIYISFLFCFTSYPSSSLASFYFALGPTYKSLVWLWCCGTF
ncbi:unnamed protein product [Ectocarpus sp. 8 AP-2014]